MRIALASEGTRGDVYPLLALAGAFRARGHEAVVCAPPDFAANAAEQGIEFRPIGDSVRGFMSDHALAVASGSGLRLLRSVSSYIDRAVSLQFEQIPEATVGADLVIGAGVQVAAASAAELHGVPYRYIVYCPAIIPSGEHSPLFPSRQLPRWVNRLAWGVMKLGFNAGLRPSLNRRRGALGLAPIRDIFRYVLSERPVIAADAELASIPADCQYPVTQIPCLHPVAGSPLPSKLLSFLEGGRPPVYVGFGSMTDADPAATTRVLLDAVERVGCRALISEGWAGLGREALPEGVMSVGAVSHAELFRRVAAVVHHGGAGTTTTAARAGAPQVLVPHLADQYYWAHRVGLLGVGPPPILRERLSAERLAETLRATTENEHLTERARRLGERLRAAADVDPTLAFL